MLKNSQSNAKFSAVNKSRGEIPPSHMSKPKWKDTPHLVNCELNGWKMKTSGDFCQWRDSSGAVFVS